MDWATVYISEINNWRYLYLPNASDIWILMVILNRNIRRSDAWWKCQILRVYMKHTCQFNHVLTLLRFLSSIERSTPRSILAARWDRPRPPTSNKYKDSWNWFVGILKRCCCSIKVVTRDKVKFFFPSSQGSRGGRNSIARRKAPSQKEPGQRRTW